MRPRRRAQAHLRNPPLGADWLTPRLAAHLHDYERKAINCRTRLYGRHHGQFVCQSVPEEVLSLVVDHAGQCGTLEHGIVLYPGLEPGGWPNKDPDELRHPRPWWHWWIRLEDGTIVDAASSQFGQRSPLVVPPDHPLQRRYVPEGDEWLEEAGRYALKVNPVDPHWVSGGCYHLALALHEATGWPIVGMVSESGSIDHAGVVDPAGRFVDGGGAHESVEAAAANYGAVAPVSMSPEELASKTIVSPIDEHDREAAAQIIHDVTRNPPALPRNLAPEVYVSPRERALTPRETWVRSVAIALKSGESWAVEAAAAAMAPLVPADAFLVPMPGHRRGPPDRGTQLLAHAIATRTGGHVRTPVVRRVQVQSSRERRRGGGVGLSPKMHAHSMGVTLDHRGPLGEPLVLIDNVVVSGATFEGARRALGRPDAIGLAYASGRELAP